MLKIGTACGTNDLVLLPYFKQLQEEELLDFLELHVKSNVTFKQLDEWRKSNLVKYVHPENGGRANFVEEYMNITIDFWTLSDFEGIVFDPGIVGESFDLTKVDEFHSLFPENMPYKTSFGDICVGYMPSEMPKQFTLDVSHAWITAYQLKLDAKELVKDFLKKKPSHIHVTDCFATRDHLIMGTGEIDWGFVVNNLPEDITVTIETDHALDFRRENIKKDLMFFRNIYNGKNK
jgi:hypothetical protein